MLSIILFGLAAWFVYKAITTKSAKSATDTVTKAVKENPEMGAIKDAVNTFRTELKPVKDQVVGATQAAKHSFTEAQHQRRIDNLLQDPRLLADALEARLASQSQLTSGETE